MQPPDGSTETRSGSLAGGGSQASPAAARTPAKGRTLVVIPTFNERENLPALLAGVLAVDPHLHVLVVDDHSPDGTGEVADSMAAHDPRISVIHRPGKLGLGGAYVAGFLRAVEMGYDRVVQMDADLSHRPEDLRRILQAAEDADVVIGSRNVAGGRVEGWSLLRKLISRGGSLFARLVLGVPVRDCTSGFKCLRRSALLAIDLHRVRSNGYVFQIEVNDACHRAGQRIVEVPIVFPDRVRGKSKMSLGIVLEAGRLVVLLRVARAMHRAPVLVVAATALVGLAAYAVACSHYLGPRHQPVIRADGAGYYAYLPAYLLQRDPTFHRFVAADLGGASLDAVGLDRQPTTGNFLDKYTIGEAAMVLPFFGVGHGLALATGAQANGYSSVEQTAVGLAGLAYLVLGLWLLGRGLRRYFSPLVTAATLGSIVFGTNLFHYGTYDSLFSHAFSFCLVAGLLELTHRWYERSLSAWLALAVGGLAGLIVLVRQADLVFLLLVPLLGVSNRAELAARLACFRRRLGSLGLGAGAFVLTLLPQLWVWHLATGRWLTYSYGSYGFVYATSPRILPALFSFDPHGLLPWCPVLALAGLGLAPMWRRARPLFLPAVIVLALLLYIIGSWYFWWYAGGYGHRGFIDGYPLLAFALASLYASLSTRRARTAVGALVAAACLLVTVQMLHYWQGLIPIDGASFPRYVSLLGEPLW